jgi:hypothetical protein
MLSVVIPIHNEEPSILPLYDRLTTVLEGLKKPYEILFVDDASTTAASICWPTWWRPTALKVIRLRRNFGQTAALAAGFDEAQGSVIISLDGDLQHAPEDIPALLAKIDEGYDIASGWRKDRIDNAVTRKIPSRIANWLMAKDVGRGPARFRHHVQGVSRGDSEGHQSLRRAASLHSGAGELLRRAHRRGAHPNVLRASGASHYGLSRTFNVMFDIITIWFLLKYFTRPMHFFGRLGLLGTISGTGILGTLGVLRVAGRLQLGDHSPLLLLGALLVLTGLMMFSTGLLGEVLMRTYFESQGRRIYAVREVRCRREAVTPGS